MGSAPGTQWSRVRAAVERATEHKLSLERQAAEALREKTLTSLRPLIAQARVSRLCERVWLFGSYAWGSPGTESDLDLLVDGDDEALSTLLAEHLRLPLHVIQLARAPETLRERVLNDGLAL